MIIRKQALAYFMILPALSIVCFWLLYPVGYSFYISLHEWYLPQSNISFLGLDNYARLLGDPLFWKSTALTLYFVIISISGALVLGLGIALLLNEPLMGRGVVKALLLIPWALPAVIVGGMWRWIYHPDYGLINGILRQIGLFQARGSISWLGSSMAMKTVILTDIWRFGPFMGIMLLAGLATIPPQLYEASVIDGANRWQKFAYVTLPLLTPTILICLILRTIFAFQVFGLIFTLTHGGPGTATHVLAYYMYSTSFEYLHMGYGAAMTYILGGLILSFIGFFLLLSKISTKSWR